MITDEIVNNVSGQIRKLAFNVGLAEDDADDLVQECLLAAIEAEGRYDDEAGTTLATFCYGAAEGRAGEWLRQRQYTVVPVSDWHGREYNRSKAAVRELQQVLGREPRNSEIAEHMGLTLEAYESLRMNADYQQTAFEGGPEEDPLLDDTPMPEDCIDGSGVVPGPGWIAERDEIYEGLTVELMNVLPQEAECLSLLFGLNGHDEHTTREVGEIFGCSHVQVQKIRDRALAKLRGRLPARGIGVEDLSLGGRENA